MESDIKIAFELLRVAEKHSNDSRDIARILLIAMAMHSLLHRDKTKTILEHTDSLMKAYKLTFKMLQLAGMEQYMEKLDGQTRANSSTP